MVTVMMVPISAGPSFGWSQFGPGCPCLVPVSAGSSLCRSVCPLAAVKRSPPPSCHRRRPTLSWLMIPMTRILMFMITIWGGWLGRGRAVEGLFLVRA
eukprot:1803971-Karenia_brevis.AAC.1